MYRVFHLSYAIIIRAAACFIPARAKVLQIAQERHTQQFTKCNQTHSFIIIISSLTLFTFQVSVLLLLRRPNVLPHRLSVTYVVDRSVQISQIDLFSIITILTTIQRISLMYLFTSYRATLC